MLFALPTMAPRVVTSARAVRPTMDGTYGGGTYDFSSVAWKSAAWESQAISSYDYTKWYEHKLQDTYVGIEACRSSHARVVPLLKEIASHDFFSYFAINLYTPCMYFPTEEAGCDTSDADAACAIQATRDRDVPSDLLDRDLHEYDFTLDGWCRKDMPSDFTEYFDLRSSPSRNTGYDGSRVWRFIHNKICFSKNLDDPNSSYKRDYNRAVSGMHSAIHAKIIASLGPSAGLIEYRRRLRDQPGAITNLYFAYMLTLCALYDCRGRLNHCSYLGEGEAIRPLMKRLTGGDLLSCEPVQRAAFNLRAHSASASSEVWRCRMRTRDLKQIMGCVQCNLWVHGTVMTLGLGATLQVLLGSDGRGGDPLALDRVQIAALVATAAKFGTACETIERFRSYDCDGADECETVE